MDPVARTFSDPDHSISEHREITMGHSGSGNESLSLLTANVGAAKRTICDREIANSRIVG